MSFVDLVASAPDAAVRAFLIDWHGAALPDVLPGTAPPALRLVYAIDDAAPGFHAINHLMRLGTLEAREAMVVFYAEEQWVAEWAVREADLRDTDPPVWVRFNEPGARWVREAPAISTFMLEVGVINATMHAPYSAAAAWLPRERAADVLGALRELPVAPWHWPQHPGRFFANGDSVAFSCPNPHPGQGEPACSVWIGARTREGLQRVIGAFPDEDWDLVAE